jgi:hypothetical protein
MLDAGGAGSVILCVMRIRVRQGVGITLLGTAALATTMLLFATGAGNQPRRLPEMKVQPTDSYVALSEALSNLGPRYEIPLAVWFAAGLVCLVWPSCKPHDETNA